MLLFSLILKKRTLAMLKSSDLADSMFQSKKSVIKLDSSKVAGVKKSLMHIMHSATILVLVCTGRKATAENSLHTQKGGSIL